MSVIPFGIIGDVPAEVVNLLLQAFRDSGFDYTLFLSTPFFKKISTPITPTKVPVDSEAVHSFNSSPMHHVVGDLMRLPDPVSKICALVLTKYSTTESQFCILNCVFSEEDTGHQSGNVVAQFNAAPIAVDMIVKGLFDSPWPLQNVAAMNGGFLTANSLRQWRESRSAEPTTEWQRVLNIKPQATRNWDNAAVDHNCSLLAAFSIDIIPQEIKAKFTRFAYNSRGHNKSLGPFLCYVDSTSVDELQIERREAQGASVSNPFLGAPLDVIDEFVKRNFPGSKLDYNRYFILDKYSVIGDYDGGNSCVVVFNEEDIIGQRVPGPKAVRMKFGEAFEEVAFLGLNNNTLSDVTERAHNARGIVHFKDESDFYVDHSNDH